MGQAITRAVLIVGGRGTRLRPLTLLRPKATVPLLNRPLLAYELMLLARYGVRDVILAMGYRADAVRETLGDGGPWGVRLTYVEETEPLGTAGAVGNLREALDGPFIAMNGDLVYDVDIAAVTTAHQASGAALTFCLRSVPDVSRFGLIECDAAGWVRAFREKQSADPTGRNTVNSGLYVMSPQVLDHIPQGRAYSNETELFPGLLQAGLPLLGYVPENQGYWADAGTLESYLEASRCLLDGAIPWLGLSATDHGGDAEGRIVPPVHRGRNVSIAPGAVVGPHVCLGDDCQVGAGSRLSNCILWDKVTVGSHCVLSAVVVSDGVTIPAGTHRDGGAVVQ